MAIREAFRLDPNYGHFLEHGGTYMDIHAALTSLDPRSYKMELGYIKSEIIKKHFNLNKVELVQGIDAAREREKHYTKNYRNPDGTKGTVFPYGLNSIEGGSGGGKTLDLPMMDIAAMLTLGLSYKIIAEILYKEYGISVIEQTIGERVRSIWGSTREMRQKLILPVIEYLLMYNIDTTLQDITHPLQWGEKRFNRYFGSIILLKAMMKKFGHFDISILNDYLRQGSPTDYGKSSGLSQFLANYGLEKYKSYAKASNTILASYELDDSILKSYNFNFRISGFPDCKINLGLNLNLKVKFDPSVLSQTEFVDSDRKRPIKKVLRQYLLCAIEEKTKREVATQLGLSIANLDNQYKKVSYYLVGLNDLTFMETRRFARMKKAIELLGSGVGPEHVMMHVFKLDPKKNDPKTFYEELFNNRAEFKDIVNIAKFVSKNNFKIL
jgi:hypothetical protein